MNQAKRFTKKRGGRRLETLFLILIVKAIILAATIQAQQKSFTLFGEVKDQQGAVILNAEILLINENGTRQKTVSDRQAFSFGRFGEWRIPLQFPPKGSRAREIWNERCG